MRIRVCPLRALFKTKVGNQSPDVRFGLQNTFKIKDFTVNIDMDGAIGGTLISTTTQKMWWGGKHPKSTMYRQEEYDNGGKPVYVPEGVNIVSGEVTYDVNGNIVSDTRVYKKNETAVNIQTWAQNYPYRAVVRTEESELFANTFSRSFLKLRRVAVTYDLTKFIQSQFNKRAGCHSVWKQSGRARKRLLIWIRTLVPVMEICRIRRPVM